MTKDDIIRMAREAGLFTHKEVQPELQRFAALVADAEAKRIHDEGMVTVGHMREQIAAEREACAELCSDIDGGENMFSRAIRARGQA